MSQTRIFKLLEGYRDQPSADLAAIGDALTRLSQLVVDCPAVKELDINPLLADETGIIALDARIRIEPSEVEMEGPNPRLAIRPYPNQWETMGGNRQRLSRLHSPDPPGRRASLRRFHRQALARGHPLPLPRAAQGVLAQVLSRASPRSTMPAPWPSSR